MTYLSEATMREAKARIASVIATLNETAGLDEDEQLKLDMIEGETDLNEIVAALLNANEEDEGVVAALKSQAAARLERARRYADRIDARRTIMLELLQIADLSKLTLPEATLSVRVLKPAPKVSDEDKLPDDYLVATWKPDLDKIKAAHEAGEEIPGVTLSNGGVSLTVRRK